MNLEDHPLAKSWIDQMDDEFHPYARNFLRTLYLVSHNKFESDLRNKIQRIAARYPRESIGLFAVTDPGDAAHEQGSVGRVNHICQSIANPTHGIFHQPTDDEIKRLKIKHIVWIDDLIGSGQRIKKYYAVCSKTQKSLFSSKRCRLHILSYQMLAKGHRALQRKSKVLENATYWNVIADMHAAELWKQNKTKYMLKFYARFTGYTGMDLGYRKSTTNIVFAHRCPNNSPIILWGDKGSWQSLFPNRMVPPALYPVFEMYESPAAELLARAHQIGDGVRYLGYDKDKIATTKKVMFDLVTLLSVLKRGVPLEKLSRSLMKTEDEIRKLRDMAEVMQAINAAGVLQPFGLDLLSRFRAGKLLSDVGERSAEFPDTDFYFPLQYRGSPRV